MNEESIITLIINSFIETNLGMPIIYLIYYVWRKHRTEDMKKTNNARNDCE